MSRLFLLLLFFFFENFSVTANTCSKALVSCTSFLPCHKSQSIKSIIKLGKTINEVDCNSTIQNIYRGKYSCLMLYENQYLDIDRRTPSNNNETLLEIIFSLANIVIITILYFIIFPYRRARLRRRSSDRTFNPSWAYLLFTFDAPPRVYTIGFK